MAGDELTIRVIPREQYVPASAFISVVEHTLDILREVDAQISDQRLGSLKWQIVNVSLNSPLTMTIVGEPTSDLDVGRDVVEAYTEGLRQIDHTSESIPPFFTYRALDHAKRLVGVLNDGVERVLFSTPEQEPVAPTQRVAANVDELVTEYEELTTFEGRLDSATVHRRRLFYVWDVFDGRIPCRFSEAQLDEVRALFGHRVSVYGRARYSRTGKPLSIEVIELNRMRDQEDLPQATDFAGINITGDLSSEAYVRSVRDAE